MPICNATKASGQPCSYQAKPGSETCGVHAPRLAPPAENQCTYTTNGRTGRRRCGNQKIEDDPHNECVTHHAKRVAKERRAAERQRILEIQRVSGAAIFALLMGVEGATQVAARIFSQRAVWMIVTEGLTEAEAIIAVLPGMEAFILRVQEHLAQRQEPDTRPELQRIATDSQSVHTTPVTVQTNKNVEILLAVPCPEGQRTIPEIRDIWSKMFAIPGRGVHDSQYADMQEWYDKRTCRATGDYLYRKVLDHLWAHIKRIDKHDLRRELYRRLQQETAESFKMCCEGHISRLANVMVGYDERFSSQVSVGELLQQKMAIISRIENVDERFRQATALMAELNVPQEEAVPWLDAIAEEETGTA